jgi:hypothetical protein
MWEFPMLNDVAFYLDGDRDLVKTGSRVVQEADVTSWGSVFRLLVSLMFSALVNSAARMQLNG